MVTAVYAAPMTEQFGWSTDDQTASRVEERRVRRDPETGERSIVPRSQVVTDLVRIGLAASEVIESADVDLDPGRPREALVRQALLNELRREGVDVTDES